MLASELMAARAKMAKIRRQGDIDDMFAQCVSSAVPRCSTGSRLLNLRKEAVNERDLVVWSTLHRERPAEILWDDSQGGVILTNFNKSGGMHTITERSG